MKIVHFLGHYPLPGGTTKAAGGLARSQALAGHEVSILTHEPARLPKDDAAGLRVVTVARGALRGYVPSREMRDFFSSRRAEIDVVVLHGMFNPPVACVGWLLRRIGLPYVVVTHCGYHPAMMCRRAWRKRLYLPIERRLLNGSVGVQLLADSQHESVRRLGVHAPTFTVPNGFAPEEVFPAHPREVPETSARMVFLGRIDAYTKGLDLLCEALTSAPRQWSLTLIGPDWGGLDSLRSLVARRDLDSRVTFAAPDYTRPPVRIISDFDLLVVPSRYEGFGFTVLEAMLAARPILVSSESGAAQYVEAAGCGWIAAPEPHSLAAALGRAWDERALWPAMGERGRAYALENLAWERFAHQSVEQYARLLKQFFDEPRTRR